ncbi:MAG: sensor histidine kinase [Paenibacillus macerans]|uniref:histidine kinase n=1 Tax=Paenibacillus macerans TaxID=44252 RepID=A0A6N8ERN5_PAEMA|nr:sensor histidine kinase [Paenibacillus macerans]MBS5910962.1 sensor histidine kinase [Paenibacillus macerans]MDU7473184.1 sensor histidine kinase [Paenibacillus macerans]MUG21312.1 HAMP domain-containing protein [Paenibacillus macerans]UMV48391.1 sensor histidine kinase [Paenibacillus macerans]GIP08408.1 sensor histidine kinase YesM [Paenibacillus macerans]
MFSRLKRLTLSLKDRVSRRLVNKLILLFTTIIILVVGSLTVISYQMLEKESVDHSIASTTNNLKLVNQNLEDYLSGIEQLSLPQIRYDEIIRAIKLEENDYSSKMYLENYLRSLFYSRDDLESIYFYLIDQKKYYSITREAYNITVRVSYQEGIPDQPWYKQAMESPHNRSFQSFIVPGAKSGYAMSKEPSFMGYHRVLRSLVSRDPKAVISFYIKPAGKDEILRDIPFEEGEHLLYLDADNVPFHVDDPEFLKQVENAPWLRQIGKDGGMRPLTWTSEDGTKYLIVYNVLPDEGWKLVKPIPYRNIYAAATTTRDLSYLIGGIFLLISVVLVTLLSSAITRPLKDLSYGMRRFSEGTFDAEIPVKGRDEIAYLSRHFNRMVRRTNDLINERYKMKLVEKNAILKALEAEINPHFLYNALQAISTKALKSGDDEVADMVDALALTLRYCISGKDIVNAREELKHIDRYLALQKARFGSRLQVTIEWDESLMELQIPKLSIQSLVENSIKHALEKVSSAITIVIRAELADTHAIISVQDNGPGISLERLEEILKSFHVEWEDQEGDNIGLKNLYTRLRLLYGEDADLVVRSGDGGAEMRMMIPRGGSSHV